MNVYIHIKDEDVFDEDVKDRRRSLEKVTFNLENVRKKNKKAKRLRESLNSNVFITSYSK